MKRFLRCRLSSHSLSIETGKHHRPLFLDHLDFAHIVSYLALGMNVMSLNVEYSSHSETSITPFSYPKPLQCNAQKDCMIDCMIVYKMITSRIATINGRACRAKFCGRIGEIWGCIHTYAIYGSNHSDAQFYRACSKC